MSRKVGIIGGGLSGLVCGSLLKGNGHSVTLIDKGRALGGRMAQKHGCDFGCPAFSLSRNTLQKSAGIAEMIKSWTDNPRVCAFPQNESLLVNATPMSALLEPLAEILGSDAKCSVRLKSIECTAEGKTRIRCSNHEPTQMEEEHEFDTLICTIPVPQLLDLLTSSKMIIAESGIRRMLNEVKYGSQMTVTVPRLKSEDGSSEDLSGSLGVYQCSQSSYLDRVLIAEEYATLQSSFDFADYLIASDDGSGDYKKSVDWAGKLVDELSDPERTAQCIPEEMEKEGHPLMSLKLAKVDSSDMVHWWRYSQITQGIPNAAYLNVPLICEDSGRKFIVKVIGDCFAMGQVEGALLSAFECAFDLIEH